jgi:hypothetical protein
VPAGDILVAAPTAHVAPVLGGEDEDAILTERLAEFEAEIDDLLADPSRAARVLTDALGQPGGGPDDALAVATEVVRHRRDAGALVASAGSGRRRG